MSWCVSGDIAVTTVITEWVNSGSLLDLFCECILENTTPDVRLDLHWLFALDNKKKMLTWKRKRICSKQQTDVSSPPPYAFWQMLFKTTAWPLWQNKTCPHLHRNLKKRWVKLWRELRQMNIRNSFYSPIFCGTSGKKALNLLQVNYCVPYRLINGGLGLTRDANMSVFAA